MPHCGYIYIKSKDEKVMIYWLGIDYTQFSSLGSEYHTIRACVHCRAGG